MLYERGGFTSLDAFAEKYGINVSYSGAKLLPMSAATVTTVQNPSPLQRKTFCLCVLRRPSRFCPRAEQPHNTRSENQANLGCSGLNTACTKCTAFREYHRIERSITRRRAKHPQPPSAQPTHQNRPQNGLLRTSSKIERRFKRSNMAVYRPKSNR